MVINMQFGWIPDYPDARDYTRHTKDVSAILKGKAKASKSTKVDLRKNCSPIVNQGNLGSCTANAASGIVEYFQPNSSVSRLFIYKATRNLMKKTGIRDRFKLHREDHYKNLFNYDSAGQTTAYLNHKPVACIVYYAFGNTFTYLYGASDYHYRNLMAPYLLQWHCIQLAKHSGYEYYDFFGVAPRINSGSSDYQYDARHQYAGVTRFKLGFGGEPRRREGTRDIVISRGKYKFYKFLRAIRRWF